MNPKQAKKKASRQRKKHHELDSRATEHLTCVICRNYKDGFCYAAESAVQIDPAVRFTDCTGYMRL